MNAELTLAIISQLLTRGPKIIISIASLFGNGNEPTVEEIKALRIDKDPEDYFEEVEGA